MESAFPAHPHHPLAVDSFTDHMLRGVKFMLYQLRFFRESDGESVFMHPEQYALWEQSMGTSKFFVKWLAPIHTNSMPKHLAAEVFGKQPSPIAALGERSVASYARHLLFGLSWSPDAVCKHLIDELGYSYANTRPMVRRILRDEQSTGKQSVYYHSKNEQSLFPEGCVNTSARIS